MAAQGRLARACPQQNPAYEPARPHHSLTCATASGAVRLPPGIVADNGGRGHGLGVIASSVKLG